jgi:hypothetical protein
MLCDVCFSSKEILKKSEPSNYKICLDCEKFKKDIHLESECIVLSYSKSSKTKDVMDEDLK